MKTRKNEFDEIKKMTKENPIGAYYALMMTTKASKENERDYVSIGDAAGEIMESLLVKYSEASSNAKTSNNVIAGRYKEMISDLENNLKSLFNSKN